MPATPPACSAIILAGGLATRLGGADKALLPFRGRPLLAHVLARLAPQVDDIVLNYNRDPAALAAFGLPVAVDRERDHAGPLAGIAAALPYCRHDLVLVVPCDSPFLPTDLRARLANGLAGGHRLAIAHDGERLQPLFLLLHRSLLPSLEEWLRAGRRKVEDWCRAQEAAIVPIDLPQAFINLNTARDLETAEKSEGEGATPRSGTENGQEGAGSSRAGE